MVGLVDSTTLAGSPLEMVTTVPPEGAGEVSRILVAVCKFSPTVTAGAMIAAATTVAVTVSSPRLGRLNPAGEAAVRVVDPEVDKAAVNVAAADTFPPSSVTELGARLPREGLELAIVTVAEMSLRSGCVSMKLSEASNRAAETVSTAELLCPTVTICLLSGSGPVSTNPDGAMEMVAVPLFQPEALAIIEAVPLLCSPCT